MRFDKGKKEIQVNFALIRRYGGTFPRRGKAFYMKTEKTYEQR